MLYGSDSHWLCRDLISHMNVSPFATVWVCVNVSISAVSALQVCFPGAILERRWEWEEDKGEEVVPQNNKDETLRKCFICLFVYLVVIYVSWHFWNLSLMSLRYCASLARTVLIKSQTCSKLIFKHLFTCFTFCSCRAVRLSTCGPSGCLGLDLSPLGPSDDEAV